MADTQYDPYAAKPVKAKKVKAEEAPASTHNSEREQYEEQQFLRSVREIQDHTSDIAGTMNEINQVYKRLKEFGFTKSDVKWAFELEEKDAPEVMATMQRRLRIARFLGHGVARQMEIFETDRTPLVDRAYEMGLNVGKLRKEMNCPFDIGSEAGQAWQRGVNDGTSFINKELAAVVAEGEPDFPDAE